MAAQKSSSSSGAIYPHFSLGHIKDPNRYWAIPFLGGLAKLIILIPVFIGVAFIAIYAVLITLFINPLIVLFTGKYWRHCFNVNIGLLKLSTKARLYFIGLINKYPGFDFTIDGFELDFIYPKVSNRYFAIPLFGGLARLVLLIPYLVFTVAIAKGALLGVVISSIFVLFKGRYPETTYELAADAVRLSLSQVLYFVGISDKYPSFYISMNNQTLKLLLVIFALSSGLTPAPTPGIDADIDKGYILEDKFDFENSDYSPSKSPTYN